MDSFFFFSFPSIKTPVRLEDIDRGPTLGDRIRLLVTRDWKFFSSARIFVVFQAMRKNINLLYTILIEWFKASRLVPTSEAHNNIYNTYLDYIIYTGFLLLQLIINI